MAKKTYETLLILDSNHYARDPGGVAKQVGDVIESANANVLVSRLWMEQKLAFPIEGHHKGTYWLAYFEAEGEAVAKIERGFQLAESVVRQLTIRLDPRLVEPILANARGERIVEETRATVELDDDDLEPEDLEEEIAEA